MGSLYSKISHLQINDKNEETIETKLPDELRTPCRNLKYLVDPRSATAGIKRTPLLVLERGMEINVNQNDTPVRPPYLETDLHESECTVRTSTPVTSTSPMLDILQSSPVLSRAGTPDKSCRDETSMSQQDETFLIDSDEEDGNEVLNNERMLFESEDQGSFDEEEDRNILENSIKVLQNGKEIVIISEDVCDPADVEVEEILSCEVNKASSENTLEVQFTEIEDCLFSAINSPLTEADDTEKSQSTWVNNKFGQQFKNKNGRIPLSVVSSNPCSPRQLSNIVNKSSSIEKNKEGKPWRDITEERANRGLLDVENTPPIKNLPPPDIIQSAPGKLLMANRGRAGKTTWGRDNSLII